MWAGGKLRIHTYRRGRRGHLATESRKRHFDPPPLAGATSRENFRTKTAVANPVEPEPEPAQGADGSLAGTPERTSRRRETSALPPPHSWRGLALCLRLGVCVPQFSPSPPAHSPFPSMQDEEDPHLHLHRPRHTIAQRGCGSRVPASRGTAAQRSAAAQQRRRKQKQKEVGMHVPRYPFPCPARPGKKATTQLNKQLPPHPDTWKNRGAQIHTPTHNNPHTRAPAAQQARSNNNNERSPSQT